MIELIEKDKNKEEMSKAANFLVDVLCGNTKIPPTIDDFIESMARTATEAGKEADKKAQDAPKEQEGTEQKEDKTPAEATGREAEATVLLIPCTKGTEGLTVKEWLAKIDEEMNEFKEAVIFYHGKLEKKVPTTMPPIREIAEEAADVMTAVTSMLEAMGFDKDERQCAQRWVNKRNMDRGRF